MLVNCKELKIITAFRQEPALILAALELILSEANSPLLLPDDLRLSETMCE